MRPGGPGEAPIPGDVGRKISFGSLEDLFALTKARFASLSVREREVFALVVTGRPNKQIAAELDLSEMTVKVHRSQITRKMRAKSLVALVRMADKRGVSAGWA